MNGWVLLVIGLASLGLVFATFAYLGYRVYRLAKAGLGLARSYGPVSRELAKKAAIATEQATEAGTRAEAIATSLASLQLSLRRLQVAVDAWQMAVNPYHRLKQYFGR